MREKVMGNPVTRFRGRETVGRDHIWKLCEEIGDTLRGGEKVSCERGVVWNLERLARRWMEKSENRR